MLETVHHEIPKKAQRHHRYGLGLMVMGGICVALAIGLFWVLQTGILYWIMMLIKRF